MLSSSRSSSNMASLPLPGPPRPPPLPHAPPVAPKRDIAEESGQLRSQLPTAPTHTGSVPPLPVGGASNPQLGLALPPGKKSSMRESGEGSCGCGKRVRRCQLTRNAVEMAQAPRTPAALRNSDSSIQTILKFCKAILIIQVIVQVVIKLTTLPKPTKPSLGTCHFLGRHIQK